MNKSLIQDNVPFPKLPFSILHPPIPVPSWKAASLGWPPCPMGLLLLRHGVGRSTSEECSGWTPTHSHSCLHDSLLQLLGRSESFSGKQPSSRWLWNNKAVVSKRRQTRSGKLYRAQALILNSALGSPIPSSLRHLKSPSLPPSNVGRLQGKMQRRLERMGCFCFQFVWQGAFAASSFPSPAPKGRKSMRGVRLAAGVVLRSNFSA